jgi:restriction system protein
MARRGFISAMNAIAREAARAQRQAEAERRRREREQLRDRREAQREAGRLQKFQEKETRQRYLEQRIEEVEEQNSALESRLLELVEILEHTLSVNDMIAFSDLRIHEDYVAFFPPSELATERPKPQKDVFLAPVKVQGRLGGWLPWIKGALSPSPGGRQVPLRTRPARI